MSHFSEKRQTDGRTERQTYRQTNGSLIGPSVGRGGPKSQKIKPNQ